MNKKIISKITSSALLFTMCAYTAPVFAYTKDETVYSKLDSNGNSHNTIVNTHIENNENAKIINDISDLLNIENSNGDEKPSQDGNNLVWNANGSDIYYQGESQKELPIECSVKYELEGKEVSAEELAGKSGKVKITIEYTNKDAHIVNINGKNETMYTPFVVVCGTILDNEHHKNIEITNGKIVDNGTKTTVIGMSLPGMQESLGVSESEIKIPSNVEITMDSTDFEMGNIMTYVTPKVIENDDLKIFDKLYEVYNKADELKSASNQLVDGTSKLNRGTHELSFELNSKINSYDNAKKKYTNKSEVEKQIVKIVNEEMKKMLPDLEKQAEIEAQNTIKRHQTELEESVVDTSMNYTKKAVQEKLAEIQANNGKILTDEQEEQLQKALAEDIKQVFNDLQSNPQIAPLLQELQNDMKQEAKAKVNSVIDSKKVNISSLTSEQVAAYASAYSSEIAKIKTINPNITDEEALKIIATVSNSTLNSVEDEIGQKIDNISTQNASVIEQKIEAEIEDYISKVTQDVATRFTNGNTEALKIYEKQIEDIIINNLKDKLSQDEVIKAYGSIAKKELTDTVDSVANETAKDVAAKYTETLSNEIVNNLIRKQLSGELKESDIDKELSKYEALINSKLNEADNGITTLKSALSQLTAGTEQLENGMKKFNDEGIEKICDLVNGDVKNVAERVEKLKELSEEYNNFTMLNNGENGNVKFIMIMDSVKKKENSKEEIVIDNKNGEDK